jgi:subtilisin-like proprotein convertase family protein
MTNQFKTKIYLELKQQFLILNQSGMLSKFGTLMSYIISELFFVKTKKVHSFIKTLLAITIGFAFVGSVSGQVNGASFGPATVCPGASQFVDFTMVGGSASATNNIELYLSDLNNPGTFSNPPIQTQASGIPGNIMAVIPSNAASGTYNFRVNSTTPAGNATTGNFTILQRIITPTYTLVANYNVGQSISVPFTTNCNFVTGNSYILEISNAAGSFASPTTITTLSGVSNGTLNGVIPSLPYGTGYRLRIRATNPTLSSMSSNAFAINPQIISTSCACNNNQTPNNQDGTYATTIFIKNDDNTPLAAGLNFQIVAAGTTGLFNTSGGSLGTPVFSFCNGAGCPSGVLNGQYYLNVHVQNSGAYSASVDGPDADAVTDFSLNTNCATLYPALPVIPLNSVNCLNEGINTFSSDMAVYSINNSLTNPMLYDGFSQTGTGNLSIDNSLVNESENDPTMELYLIKQVAGCRVSSFEEFKVFRASVPTLTNTFISCRATRANDTLYLNTMLDSTNTGGGRFFIGGNEVIDGKLGINSPVCVMVTYSITDSCGVTRSDTKNLQVTLRPNPNFNFATSAPISPLCSRTNVTIDLVSVSTGANPQYSIISNNPLYSGSISGNSANLQAPAIGESVRYTICLSETNNAPPICGSLPPQSACTANICKNYTVYRDRSDCGANALFTSTCADDQVDVCPAFPRPGINIGCSFFNISTPDVLESSVSFDENIYNCDDENITGSYSVSFIGLDAGVASGGPTLGSLPGLNVVCRILNFKILGWRPLGALYNILGCGKSLLQAIFDFIAIIAGGSGGGYIVMADTDGDGGFDYIIDNKGGDDSTFPGTGTFSLPNKVKGNGFVTVRAVSGWVNKPSSVCGNFDIEPLNILDRFPIGAIPIVGAVVEALLNAGNCGIDVALSQESTESVKVINNSEPEFINCNPGGYTFAQTLDCTIPVNWSIPAAVDGCSDLPLLYAGPATGASIANYVGTNPPTLVNINAPGIYQTAGPVPGSSLQPGVYPITYTAVSCNGLPTLCSFNVVVTAGNPILECPNDLTVSSNQDLCTRVMNGLAPYQGLGCASIINYSFTSPVTNTVFQTNATTIGTHNIPDGIEFELGTTTISYNMLVDINGDGDYDEPNENQTCTFDIVVEDNQTPEAVCLDVDLQLNNLGAGTVFASEMANQIYIDGGSIDNCSISNLAISKDNITFTSSLDFDCAEIGQNVIILRVTDGSGNISFCKSVVSVVDFFEGFKLDLDVPEVCFEPFQDTFDFSKYIVIAKPDGLNVAHANVSTLGPEVVGSFGISAFLPDPGSTNDPGMMTTDGVYTLGTGTGWITISYILSINEQVNQIADTTLLTGCFRMVHDVFRVEKLDPIWRGGYMCCDQNPVWLGGAVWNGTGNPPIPAGMLSLTDIRGSYPGDVYGEWIGQGVSFVDPDGVRFTGDEFFQFDPSGLDGTYTLTYLVGDEPCEFSHSQEIRVTCQDLHVDISDYTVCPANWVEEKQVLVNLDDFDLVISTTGFNAIGAAGGRYADGSPVMDLDSVVVNDGRVVIPGFYAPVVRDQDFEICVTTFQVTPFGCADVFCYTITVQDLIAPDFQNCAKEPIVVDAPEGWCSSFVNFEYPWAEDNCMGLYSRIEQVDLTGLKSGDLFPVGLTILSYTATDTVGNQSYCELKIIVNDFHTPPSVTCPTDKTQTNDLNKCGAIVNNIAPVSVDDNCIDNTTVIYEVKDATGTSIACGFEDASGQFFPVGMSTVEYRVEDQPLILITEIVQNGVTTGVEITNFGPAAVDVTCGRFLMKNAAGMVIDSFTIPTRNNKSTYGVTPIYPPDPVVWVLPNPNIVPVGGTFTHTFRVNPPVGEIRKYCFTFIERVIDEATINDLVDGEVILRKNVCDNNLQTDFVPATPCDPGSFGLLNPGLPTMTPNGTTTALQNYAPSIDECTFKVTVNDREAPTCIKHDSITIANTMVPVNIAANACMVSTVTMASGLVHDVNIHDLQITIPNAGAITAYLSSPAGTRIKLFDGICSGQPNVDVTLDETIVWTPAPSIVNALCNPLGRAAIYRPEESFKAFYGENAGGLWTLEIFTSGTVTGVLTNWDLEVLYQLPYDQPSVTLNNAPGLCDTTFTWIHPIFEDNCCKGTVDVTYSFSNNVTGETSTETEVILNSNGTINLQGLEEIKVFKVGKTIVEYTLTDQYGNLNTCGFMVTVLDTEKPVFTGPACPDVEIQLLPGECLGQMTFFTPRAEDNCAMVGVTYCFEDGSPADIGQLPIGVYNIIAKAEDIYGNIGTCTFQVSVLEFIPTNSTMACNDNLNISLDNNCETVLTADMILEGNNYRCYDNYCITITDLSGNPHANLFTLDDEGKAFIVTISDCVTNSGVSCWGYVNIEEKLIPEFLCPADLTVACNIDVEARDPDPLIDTLLTGEAKLLSCEMDANINWQDEWISYGQCSNPRALVKRTWTIIDSEGNRVECVQNITIRPLDLNDVVFPADIEFHQAINCADVITNPDLTQPNQTGWPLLNGIQVNKSGSLCMVSINYTDEIYDICEGSYEILRYWKIRNMCLPVSTDNPRVHVQVIKVLDTKGPKIVDCPSDITLSVSPWGCRADAELPLPAFVGDACTDDFEFRYLIYGGGEIYGYKDTLNQQHVKVSELTIGNYTVKYLYKDKCGNKSECSLNIKVIDASSPVAVAKQNIVISLSGDAAGNGSAKLYGWQIDNGSYDHCTPVTFEVRRLSGGACDNFGANGTHNNNSTYNNHNGFTSEVPGRVWFHPMDNMQDTDGGEFVKFCCDDIPSGAEFGLHDVEMRVWDDGNMNGVYGDNEIINGLKDNYNTTWVTIRVENKLPPVLVCPPDVTVTCDMELNLSLDQDTAVDSVDLRMTGIATAYDLCSGLSVTYRDAWVGANNPVCKNGVVRRTFKVTKGNIVVTCPQLITVTTITTPFTATFPQNAGTTEWNACSFSLDDARDASNPIIKKPIVNYGQCDIVGENIKIDTFLFEDGACKKWRVEYTYKNWCTNEDRGPFVHYYTYKDEVAPALTCTNQMFAAMPNPANPNGGCEGSVILEASATDALICADESWVKWQMFFDGWADGTVDRLASSFVNKSWNGIWVPQARLIAGQPNPIWISLQNQHPNSPLADIVYVTYVRPSKASGGNATLPAFILDAENISHKVLWKITDGCGNVDQCESTVMVVDKKAPTPYCVSLSTAVMQTNPKMVELWAKDFDKGGFDNCSPQSKLYFTFDEVSPIFNRINDEHFYKVGPNGVVNATLAEYNAGNAYKWLPSARSAGKIWTSCGDFTIKISVWDEAWNTDYCNTNVKIIGCGTGSIISGQIASALGNKLEGVSVIASAALPEYPKSVFSNATGQYQFDVQSGLDYDLIAIKDGDYLNGVTTLDLVLIQRHILGLEVFNDPYKVIAADANNDGRITASDLVEIRKLILGVTTSFKNASWRMPIKNQTLTLANPFPYKDNYSFSKLESNMVDQDFVAVKIGDLNSSASVNFKSSEVVESRANRTLSLVLENQSVKVGQNIAIPVTSNNFIDVLGYQMTLNLTNAEYERVESGLLEINESNIGDIGNGIVTMSFASSIPVSAKPEDVLFTIYLKAAKSGTIKDILRLTSDVTPLESYSSDLSIGVVKIVYSNEPSDFIVLNQNEPNPFIGHTVITFTMPDAADALLSIYDINGKQLKSIQIDGVKGLNSVNITKDQLGGVSGIMYYTLESGDFTATKKMIIVE